MASSFAALKRRATDLIQTAQQNLPAVPAVTSPLSPRAPRKDTINGTWERVDVPDLPRSSHTIDIVSGSAYLFGGEVNIGEPVDNDMHIMTLPWNHAGADYYKIKAKAAQQDQEAPATPPAEAEPEKKPEETKEDGKEELSLEAKEFEEAKEKGLDDVPLTPGVEDDSDVAAETEEEETKPKNKGKGKEPALPEPPKLGDVPGPRVGHATAVIGARIFLFGGRGGPEMTPLEEAGRVWVFDTRSHTWSHIDPAPVVKGGAIIPHPAPRSYHCATATDRPRDFAQPRPKPSETWSEWALGDTSKTGTPQAPIIGHVAEDAVDEESEGYGTLFIHGGCLANGERTNDIWAFNVHDRSWSELPRAPGPARSGSAICISKTRLFRFGGSDGNGHIGGQLDFLHLEVETFDDRGSKGEVAIRARGGWQSILQDNPEASSHEIPVEPVQEWPAPRSSASLEALAIGGGREYLVLSMGEREPIPGGPEGADKFHSDVWMFQVPPLGMTPASVTAAFMQAIGRKTGEGKWTQVDLKPYDEELDEDYPEPRGLLASAPMGELDENGIFIWGGVGEDGLSLGDGWILRVGE